MSVVKMICSQLEACACVNHSCVNKIIKSYCFRCFQRCCSYGKLGSELVETPLQPHMCGSIRNFKDEKVLDNIRTITSYIVLNQRPVKNPKVRMSIKSESFPSSSDTLHNTPRLCWFSFSVTRQQISTKILSKFNQFSVITQLCLQWYCNYEE